MENYLFPDKFSFLSYVLSSILLSFGLIFWNFGLVLVMKNLLIKKHLNSTLNADQSNFLANKTVRNVLE